MGIQTWERREEKDLDFSLFSLSAGPPIGRINPETLWQRKHSSCDVREARIWVSQAAQVVESLPTNAGDARHVGSVRGWGRYSGGWHGHPLQYWSPMDRGAWRAVVHGVAKSQIRLKELSAL